MSRPRPRSPRCDTRRIDWGTVTWTDFVRAVEGFGAREDGAYLRCRTILDDAGSMLARAERSGDLVRFLNAWACRLDSKKAPGLFRDWIAAHASALEALEPVAVTDPRVPQ